MKEKKHRELDECAFLRYRAMALWDEGLIKEARRLLAVIDQWQARLIAKALRAQKRCAVGQKQ